MGLAYTPGAEPDEVRAVFALAAERKVPCFVHVREQERVGDAGPLEEVIEHAKATGASLHVVHINSCGTASGTAGPATMIGGYSAMTVRGLPTSPT